MDTKKIINKIFGYWFRPRLDYQPLIEIRIFEDAILHNLEAYQQKYPFLDFAPVLKSNAYGHSLVKVARILDDKNLPFFVVDSFYEALTLRQHGIKTKILILGYVSAEQIFQNIVKNISIGITGLEQLKTVVAGLKNSKIFHLKIDTGMNRQGIALAEMAAAADLIKSNRFFILEGICTHLADADHPNSDLTNQQIIKWQHASDFFKNQFPEIKYCHAAASAGAALGQRASGNVCRLGIGLYGVNPLPENDLVLRPALEIVSVISQIKAVQGGERIGYGGSYTVIKPMIAALLPLGYNEGVDRRLSDRGFVLVAKQFCPIVGRVSMNISAIDVSAVPSAQSGDQVVVISRQPGDPNSIANIAKLCDTIPYEILVRFPSYLRRTVVSGF